MNLKLTKPILWVITIISAILCSLLLAVMVWFVTALLDKETPLHMISYKADDAYIGETVKESIIADRVRVCEYKFSKMATDSKGRIVFYTEGGRLVNGPLGRIVKTDEYPIDKRAAPGKAVMHWYSQWVCPGNPLHFIKPMQKEYTDTFLLKLRPGQEDLSSIPEDEPPEIKK